MYKRISHSGSLKILNSDSSLSADQSSRWWKYLSENRIAKSMKNTDMNEQQLMENEFNESDVQTTKLGVSNSLFTCLKSKSPKNRCTEVFNAKTTPDGTGNVPQSLKLTEFKDQSTTKNDSLDLSQSSEFKKRTKPIFTNKRSKRRYSDAFIDEIEDDRLFGDQVFGERDLYDALETSEKNDKRVLFEVKQTKKKYSEAFLNELVEKNNEHQIEKSSTSISNDSEDSKKPTLFKINNRNKKYSLAFSKELEGINAKLVQERSSAISIPDAFLDDPKHENIVEKDKSEEIHKIEIVTSLKKPSGPVNLLKHKIHEDSESKQEIFTKDTKSKNKIASTSHKSRKKILPKMLEQTRVDKVNKGDKSFKSSTSKNEESVIKSLQMEPNSESFNEEYNIERIKSQKDSLRNVNRNASLKRFSGKILQDDTNYKIIEDNEILVSEHSSKKNQNNDKTSLNTENINTKSKKILLKQKNNLKKSKNRNTKYLSAPLKFTKEASQSVKEENNIPQSENIDAKISRLHDSNPNDTTITSIDISNKARHSLFHPKYRKALNYNKSLENIKETDIPQNQEVQKGISCDTKKSTLKQIRKPSTSSPESAISRYFEESLISSTKLFFYPNDENRSGPGDDKLVKNKNKSSKDTSITDLDLVKSKNYVRTPQSQRRSSQRKSKNSKMSTILTEDSNDILAKDNELVEINSTNDEENAEIEIEEIMDNKNSILSETKMIKSKKQINENSVNDKIVKMKTKSTSTITSCNQSDKDSYELLEKNTQNEMPVKERITVSNKSRKSKILPFQHSDVLNNNREIQQDANNTSKNQNISKSYLKNKDSRNMKSFSKKHRETDSEPSDTEIDKNNSQLEENQTSNSKLNPIDSRISQNRQSSRSNSMRFASPISGIITINSSISRAKLSQISNGGMYNKYSTCPEQPEYSNVELDVGYDRMFLLKNKIPPESSEEEDIELLKTALTNISYEKKKRPLQPEINKKITDYFKKEDKPKPIPKKTVNIKKASKPVCTARLVNGKPYRPRPLYRGERWCTQRFYKFLHNKMQNGYGDDTKNASEKLMKFIVQSVKTVRKAKKYLEEEVNNLKKELARHGIIQTTYDFYCFCFDYLPIEYRDLVVPQTQAYTLEPTVPYNEKEVFNNIEF